MSLPADCRQIRTLLAPARDGALDAATTIAVDDHLAGCPECQEHQRFEEALRASLKRTAPSCSEDLRARFAARLAAVAAEEPAAAPAAEPASPVALSVPPPAPRSRVARLRPLAPWAAAAAVVLAVGGYEQHRAAARRVAGGPLSDFVAEHARPLPPETKEVQGLGTYVGVPVHPVGLKRVQAARFVGGRVLPVQHERAAQLQYEVPSGGRVSVFVYDPSKLQIDADDLDPHPQAGKSPGSAVRVGRSNGYSVAVSERGGVGYAVTADMDPELTAAIAAELDP